MATDRRKDDPAAMSSADMIRRARDGFEADRPSGDEASAELMAEARVWLERNQPDAVTAGAMTGTELAVPEVPEISMPDDEAIEREVARTLESGMQAPPARRPSPRRPAPFPAPLPEDPADTGRPTRSRNRVIGLAIAIGLAALAANVAGVFFEQVTDDDGQRPATTVQLVVPVIEFTEGSITSASDPCSGATVSGDLEAITTYLPDPVAPEVEFELLGTDLRGSDGTSYTLELRGATKGEAGQQTFVFDSDWMVLSREDGIDFIDSATVTVEIVDGRPATWSYSSVGAECPG